MVNDSRDSGAGDWHTVKDASRLLGVSERTIWRRVKAGELRIDRTTTPHLVDISDALVTVATESELVSDAETRSVAEMVAEIARLEAVLSEVRDSLEDARRERDEWRIAFAEYMRQTDRLLSAGDEEREERDRGGILQRFGRWLAGDT